MRSTISSWDYIFKLKKGDLSGVLANYFTNSTIVRITRRCNGQKEYSSLSIFCKYLKQVKILQFKVQDVAIANGITTFKLLLITKNKCNQIDFTQHDIINRWKGSKIIEHQHTITS